MQRTIYCDRGKIVMSGSNPASDWHLAQINVGRLVAPHGDPRVAAFFDALERVNALAERPPGFVWRLQSEAGNATDIQTTPDPLFPVNMSVWLDAEALFDFVYRSAHTTEMAKRREYFERFDGAYQALWWVPAGHLPGVDEGLSRLWRLDRYGPTRKAPLVTYAYLVNHTVHDAATWGIELPAEVAKR